MIVTHRHVNYAKDEGKMKIPCKDPWCLNESKIESTPKPIALCFSQEISLTSLLKCKLT
jgi:hypothetical protein